MKPALFTYHRAETVERALSLLGQYGADAKVIAGGQSLAPMLNLRMARPAHLVDLNDLLELDSVRIRDGALEIGGMTRHHRVATDAEIRAVCPILAVAAASIGHYAIRQRGTLAGSLCHADPAAQMPLVATLFDAAVVTESRTGSRIIPARQFFLTSLVTTLEPDEIVTSVRFPLAPNGTGWAFELFSQRRGDFAVASVAVLLGLAGNGTVDRLSLSLGGMAPTPLAMDEAALPFLGGVPDMAWQLSVAQAIAQETAPENEVRIPAGYRRGLAAGLIRRALAVAADRARRHPVS